MKKDSKININDLMASTLKSEGVSIDYQSKKEYTVKIRRNGTIVRTIDVKLRSYSIGDYDIISSSDGENYNAVLSPSDMFEGRIITFNYSFSKGLGVLVDSEGSGAPVKPGDAQVKPGYACKYIARAVSRRHSE